MMHKYICLLLCLFGFGVVAANENLRSIPANAPTNSSVLVWRGEPLKIDIAVRKDRVIKFEGSSRIQVGVPLSMQGIASAESIRGIVYLRSFKAFENERFWFRDKDTQEIFVAEISATETGSYSPVVVVRGDTINQLPADPEIPSDDLLAGIDDVDRGDSVTEFPPVVENGPTNDLQQQDLEDLEDRDAPLPIHGKTVLARYAFQSMYAPDRLINGLDNVHQISIDRDKSLSNMFVGGQVSARPLAQWRNGHQFVTAFILRNNSDKPAKLDPRRIRGAEYWDASSFMTDSLSPRDEYGDVTAMVVISDKRYEEYSEWLR